MTHPRASRRRFVTPGRVALIALLGLTACIGVAGYQLIDARHQLQMASQTLSGMSSTVNGGEGLSHVRTRRAMQADLLSAQVDFSRARSDLWLWSPLLSRMGWLPVVGPQLQAAWPISLSGGELTAAGNDLLKGLAPTWPAMANRSHSRPLLSRLASPLQEGVTWFQSAHGELEKAMAVLPNIPTNVGNAQLSQKIRTVRQAVPTLLHASEWLSVAPRLLGVTRPMRILLAWEDPKELRATGGFIAAANYLTVTHGRIVTHGTGSVLPRERQLPLPAPEAAYTYETNWLFRDSNWSPDFPLSARYERYMYGVDTGRWASMVVDVLGGGADILGTVGPIYLPQYRRTVTSGNVGRLINYYQRHPLRHPPDETGAQNDKYKKQFLADLAKAMLNRFQSLGVSGLVNLGRGLSSSLHGQRLLLYARSSAIQAAVNGSGGSGAFMTPHSDSLLIVDDNRSYNKINPYVRERARYDVFVEPKGEVHAKLTIRYHLLHSPASLQGAGPFFGRLAGKHAYQDFIRVYVPPGASLGSERGLARWAPANAYGRTQFAGRLLLRPGQTQTATFDYRVPSGIFHAAGSQHYRLLVQRQPGGNLSRVRVVIHVGPGMAIPGAGARKALNIVMTKPAASIVTEIVGSSFQAPAMPAPRKPGQDPYVPDSLFPARLHRL